MELNITDRIFCWIFNEIIGGEIFETTESKWVVRCNGDLYNETGVIYQVPQIAYAVNIEQYTKQIWEDLCLCDRKELSLNEFYNEIIDYVEDLFDESEERKAKSMADSISNKHELWSPTMLETNYFSLTSVSKNQAYFLFLYSEYELEQVETFLTNAEMYAKEGILPPIFAAGKMLWENSISYVYVIYEKSPKILGFDALNTSKLNAKMVDKITDAIKSFESKLEEAGLQTYATSKNKFFFDRGTCKLYVKTPTLVREKSLLAQESLVSKLLA